MSVVVHQLIKAQISFQYSRTDLHTLTVEMLILETNTICKNIYHNHNKIIYVFKGF